MDCGGSASISMPCAIFPIWEVFCAIDYVLKRDKAAVGDNVMM